jgi:hypothetical protein
MKAPALIATAILLLTSSCEIYPRNTLKDCRMQCEESKKSKACYEFCSCIHNLGHTLDSCLAEYDQSPEDSTERK